MIKLILNYYEIRSMETKVWLKKPMNFKIFTKLRDG